MEKAVVSTAADIRNVIAGVLASKADKGGIKNVYCVACGGSLSCLYPMTYLIRSEAKTIWAESITANEFVHATPKALGENSLVFAMSLAGSTPETVAAAHVAKERGAAVISLCAAYEVPLSEPADYTVYYRVELDRVWEQSNQAIILNLGFELLHQLEEYPYYEDAMDAMKKLSSICAKAREKVIPRALEWGKKMEKEPVIYTMGSGPSYYVSYMQCICMFMEMEWVHSNSIHCGEYFHGPFEITDRDTPFLVFVSDGRTRALDERVLKFLRTYAEKVEILDVKEYGINSISDHVVEYFCCILHWALGLEYAEGLAQAKQHPLMMRRYLGKVPY